MAKRVSLAQFGGFIAQNIERIQTIRQEVEELQVGFNGKYVEFKAQHDATLTSLVNQITDDPEIAGPELGRMIADLIGGERDFVDSYYGNFYSNNGGYLKYEQMIANIVLVTFRHDVFYRMYSEYDDSNDNLDPGETRSDLWIGATLFVEARVTNWLSFNLTCSYEGNISDYAFRYTDATTNQVENYPVDFNRVELMGGARFYY